MLIGKIIHNRKQRQFNRQNLDQKQLFDEEQIKNLDQRTSFSEGIPSGDTQRSSTSTNPASEIEKDQISLQSATTVNIPPFYLNLLLLNKSEVVENRVLDKTGEGFLGRAAVYAANKMVTDEEIVSNIANSLISVVSKTIDEMGITADFAIKFTKGSFLVIKIQITEVDILQLVLSAKGPEYASEFTRLLTATERLGMVGTVLPKIQTKIYSNINDGMIQKFNELIPTKMAEKSIHVDCHACKTEDQAEVFFELHDRLLSLQSS